MGLRLTTAPAFILSFVFSLGSSALYAETFFYKKDDGSIGQTEMHLKFDDKQTLKLGDTKFFAQFSSDKDGLKSGPIAKREPTEAEKIADGAVMMLTALMIMSTHDTYDLSKDLRMSRVLGLLFFIFPFEDEDIYRKCGDNEYLVAVTSKPEEETLKQLKSLDEVRRLCGGAESSNPRS